MICSKTLIKLVVIFALFQLITCKQTSNEDKSDVSSSAEHAHSNEEKSNSEVKKKVTKTVKQAHSSGDKSVESKKSGEEVDSKKTKVTHGKHSNHDSRNKSSEKNGNYMKRVISGVVRQPLHLVGSLWNEFKSFGSSQK